MSNTNQAVQPQKMVIGLKVWIENVEGFFYLCSKKTLVLIRYAVTGQLTCVFVFACAKIMFP